MPLAACAGAPPINATAMAPSKASPSPLRRFNPSTRQASRNIARTRLPSDGGKACAIMSTRNRGAAVPLVGTPRLAAAKGWVFTIRSLADSWSAATAATACLDIRVTMPGAGLDVARRNLAHACGRRLNAMSVEGRRTGRQPRSGARIARRNIMDRTVSAATSCRNRNAPKSENARWRLLQGTVNATRKREILAAK